MNCVQALAVAAAALATSGLPIEAHMAEARCLMINVEARSEAMLHAATDAFAERLGYAAADNKLVRVELAYAPDGWIHGAMRHPL